MSGAGERTGTLEWIGSIYREMMVEAQEFGATVPVMPEISRFLGIVISMPFSDHEPPHFHARYGDHKISVGILDGQVTGQFPRRARAFVLEWRAQHEAELIENWNRARGRRPLMPIAPLE